MKYSSLQLNHCRRYHLSGIRSLSPMGLIVLASILVLVCVGFVVIPKMGHSIKVAVTTPRPVLYTRYYDNVAVRAEDGNGHVMSIKTARAAHPSIVYVGYDVAFGPP